MITGISAVVALGYAFVSCAFALLWGKACRLSIWKMPKLRIAMLTGCVAVATVAGQKGDSGEQGGGDVKGELVLHCTFDSAIAVTDPAVGAGGTCAEATFVEGKVGAALHVPAQTKLASLSLPEGLPAQRGCIEFWAKIASGNAYYSDCGQPDFFWAADTNNVGIAFLRFTSNNGGGGAGLFGGIEPFLLFSTQSCFDPNYSSSYSRYLGDSIFGWHHYAVVWNVDGITAINGNPRVAIILDGMLQGSSSGGADWNKNDFMAAISRPSDIFFSTDGHSKRAYSIDEFKIWNYDKTTFSEPGKPAFVYHKDVTAVYDGQGHTLAAPVGATGDETFLYSLDRNGPFGADMPSLVNAGSMQVWYKETVGGESIVTSAVVTVAKRTLTFTSASATKPYDGTPLTADDVAVAGELPAGENFTFTVTGSQTVYGESDNSFTWAAGDGTDAGNYDITVVNGKLNVTMGDAGDAVGYEVVDVDGGSAVRVTNLSYPGGGDVTLPATMGGLPVVEIAPGALAGASVTGVRVPAGVVAAGSLFENLHDVTNVSFAAAAGVSGALSFRGCASLREVVAPASTTALDPWTFLGCWNLERVVFSGEPPFGGDAVAGADKTELLVSSVRPASLLQMADMICYPRICAAKWEKSLRNLGYGGRYGAYEGEWTGVGSIVEGTGNLNPPVAGVVTNVIVSVVTNVLVPGSSSIPGEGPDAVYAAQTGRDSGTVLDGAAGWDVFGLPDGMTWDRDTGTLAGSPLRSGSYDLMLVSGSGTQTKLMRTTLDVAGYAVTTGYVGVAFRVSGAPWNALASYKTVPKGLKWSGKTLSGVPSKAGTTTYKTTYGEPVKITILSLPAGATGTFAGVLVDAAGKHYPLNVSATTAGKISATVVKGTKSYSLSAAKWSRTVVENVDGTSHRIFEATLTAKGLALSVKVDADAIWNADALTAVGTLGAVKNLAGTAQRNSFASDSAAKAVAADLAGTYALKAVSDETGGWTLALTEAGEKGALTVVLNASGTAKLSGTLPDKKKVSVSATLHVDVDMAATLKFYSQGVWIHWTPPQD